MQSESTATRSPHCATLFSGGATQKANLAKDITLFAILAGGISFDEIAAFEKDNYTGDDPTFMALVARYSKPRNKYLFPLRQSERTSRQLREYVNTLFSATIHVHRSLTPADIWSTIAYDCGISPEEIMSCTGKIPATNPAFALTGASPADSDNRAAILRRVSDTLTSNPSNWYALQMRHGTDYDDIARRIEAHTGRFSIEETYYPCREIARRTGRKFISENKPVVAGLMFVKCRFTDITAMMRCISDIAWCYRQTARTGSAYAAIPRDANQPLPADNRHIHPLYRNIPRRDAPHSSGRQSSGNRRRILRTTGSIAAADWPRQRSDNMPPHPPGSQQHRMAR